LVSRAIARYTPGNNLTTLCYIPPKPGHILIVYAFNLIYTERTNAFSASAASFSSHALSP